MATTPTYSWPIPDDTDLVKDGAEAIRDLGNAIDTTVGGLGSGLVHIDTVAIGTTVSAVSLDNVFSATYKMYKVFLKVNELSATFAQILLRLRVGGVDLTGSVYINGNAAVGSTRSLVLTGTNNSTLTGFITGEGSNVYGQLSDVTLANPFEADQTNMTSLGSGALMVSSAASVNNTTSYDGFTIYPGSGTITGGLISVFGIKE